MKPGGKSSAGEPAHPSRGRARDADATRAALLRAATAEFAGRGFAGARVDEIAERAGVNKRMIYLHFGDKRRLFREVLRAHLSGPRARSRPGTDGRSALTQQISGYFELLARDPDVARLLAWAVLSSAGRREQLLLLADAARGLRSLDEVIRSGVGTSTFRADVEPEPVRAAVLAACLGYFLQLDALRSASPDGAAAFSDDDFVGGLCRILLDGILASDVAAREPAGGAAPGDARREGEG